MSMGRTMYVNDSYPPLRFQLNGGQTVLNLTTATSITVHCEGQTHSFSGPGIALFPFVADPNGLAQYNLQYNFSPGDTAQPEVFSLFIVVEWPAGQQTFYTSDTLTVLPLS